MHIKISSKRTTFNLLLAAVLLAPIYGGASAVICLSALLASLIYKFNRTTKNSELESYSLLSFGVVYVGYFCAREFFLDAPQIYYVFTSNLAFIVCGLICLFIGARSFKNVDISSVIAIWLLFSFLIYLGLKLACDIELLPDFIASEIGSCVRIKFLGRNQLMSGGIFATLAGILFVTIDISNRRDFFLASIALACVTYIIVLGVQSRGATLSLICVTSLGLVWQTKNFGKKLPAAQLILSTIFFLILTIIPGLDSQFGLAMSRIHAAQNTVNVFALNWALGFVLAVGLIYFYSGKYLSQITRFTIIVLSLAVGLFYLLESGVFDQLSIFSSADKIDLGDTSTKYRLDMYRAGLVAFLDSPFYGYGYSQRFNAAVNYLTGSMPVYGHLHNAIINHLVAGGIFGLITFLFICFPGIISFVKSRFSLNTKNFLFLQIYASFFVTGLTTSTMGHFVNTTFYASVIAMTILMEPKEIHEKSTGA